MIRVLFAASWRHLARDRAALLLSFVLPVAFFSLSALAFRGMHGDAVRPVAVEVVDLDRSDGSRRLVAALAHDPVLAVRAEVDGGCGEPSCAIAQVRRSIERERAAAGLVIERGFGRATASPGGGAALTAVAPAGDVVTPALLARSVALAASSAARAAAPSLVTVAKAPERSGRAARGALAGLLVVFLLFTAAGASGWLVEEEQQGTLSLLLATKAGLGRILGSQWLFLSSLGSAQAAVMIAWARLGFGVAADGVHPLGRVALVTVGTAAATAAFGILLATVVRTRAQLGATSTIAILLLSALGGSFIPREAMPEAMRALGAALPTTWATSGLWLALEPDGTLASVLPATGRLTAFAAGFLVAAAAIARRRVVV